MPFSGHSARGWATSVDLFISLKAYVTIDLILIIAIRRWTDVITGLPRNLIFTGFCYDLQVITHGVHGAKGEICPFSAVTWSAHS
jgi:hypothetical protein